MSGRRSVCNNVDSRTFASSHPEGPAKEMSSATNRRTCIVNMVDAVRNACNGVRESAKCELRTGEDGDTKQRVVQCCRAISDALKCSCANGCQLPTEAEVEEMLKDAARCVNEKVWKAVVDGLRPLMHASGGLYGAHCVEECTAAVVRSVFEFQQAGADEVGGEEEGMPCAGDALNPSEWEVVQRVWDVLNAIMSDASPGEVDSGREEDSEEDDSDDWLGLESDDGEPAEGRGESGLRGRARGRVAEGAIGGVALVVGDCDGERPDGVQCDSRRLQAAPSGRAGGTSSFLDHFIVEVYRRLFECTDEAASEWQLATCAARLLEKVSARVVARYMTAGGVCGGVFYTMCRREGSQVAMAVVDEARCSADFPFVVVCGMISGLEALVRRDEVEELRVEAAVSAYLEAFGGVQLLRGQHRVVGEFIRARLPLSVLEVLAAGGALMDCAEVDESPLYIASTLYGGASVEYVEWLLKNGAQVGVDDVTRSVVVRILSREDDDRLTTERLLNLIVLRVEEAKRWQLWNDEFSLFLMHDILCAEDLECLQTLGMFSGMSQEVLYRAFAAASASRREGVLQFFLSKGLDPSAKVTITMVTTDVVNLLQGHTADVLQHSVVGARNYRLDEEMSVRRTQLLLEHGAAVQAEHVILSACCCPSLLPMLLSAASDAVMEQLRARGVVLLRDLLDAPTWTMPFDLSCSLLVDAVEALLELCGGASAAAEAVEAFKAERGGRMLMKAQKEVLRVFAQCGVEGADVTQWEFVPQRRRPRGRARRDSE